MLVGGIGDTTGLTWHHGNNLQYELAVALISYVPSLIHRGLRSKFLNFANNNLTCIFLKRNFHILIHITLQSVPKGPMFHKWSVMFWNVHTYGICGSRSVMVGFTSLPYGADNMLWTSTLYRSLALRLLFSYTAIHRVSNHHHSYSYHWFSLLNV